MGLPAVENVELCVLRSDGTGDCPGVWEKGMAGDGGEMDIDGTAAAAGADCCSAGFAEAGVENGSAAPRGAGPEGEDDGVGAGFACFGSLVVVALCGGVKGTLDLGAPALPSVDEEVGADGWNVCAWAEPELLKKENRLGASDGWDAARPEAVVCLDWAGWSRAEVGLSVLESVVGQGAIG